MTDMNEEIIQVKEQVSLGKFVFKFIFCIFFLPIFMLIVLVISSLTSIWFIRLFYIVIFIALPLINIIIKIRKKWKFVHTTKALISSAPAIFMILVNIGLLILFLPYRQTNLSRYMTGHDCFDTMASEVMPSLLEIGEYEEISYLYFKQKQYIFKRESVLLEVVYNQDTYPIEKTKISNDYVFLTEPVISGNYYLLPAYEFQISNYYFQVVYIEEAEYHYPKSISFIAYNDDKQSIVYMYFFDFDLDSIGETGDNPNDEMVNFIEYNFPYDWE